MFTLLIVLLFVIAVCSPLCTFTTYSQQKEWRFDRTFIALKEDGVLQTLLGKLRGGVAILYIVVFLLPMVSEQQSIALAIGILAVLTIVQFGLRKQRVPVLTTKAKAVLAVAAGINCVLLLYLFISGLVITPLTVAIVLLQPVIVALALVLLTPLDLYLKRKTYNQAKALRNQLSTTTVIAITGSVGKTTCKHILAQLLNGKDAIITPQFVNTELGTCNWFIQTMQKRTTIPEILVVEMGAYKAGEIALMCSIFRPTISVVTHIGSQHIGLFGSQQKLLNAKAEILEAVPSSGHTLFPGEQWYTEQLQQKSVAPSITVGQGEQCALQARGLKQGADGLHFAINETLYFTPIQGEHNIHNILLAIGVAQLCTIEDAVLQRVLQNLTLPTNTYALSQIGTYTLLDDSHNNSPDSLKAVIEWAKQHSAEYKVLITSGLIEQGSLRNAVHQKFGRACKNVFDVCICTDKRAASELEVGYGTTVFPLKGTALQFPANTLIVCEGKVPMDYIKRVLHSPST